MKHYIYQELIMLVLLHILWLKNYYLKKLENQDLILEEKSLLKKSGNGCIRKRFLFFKNIFF